VRNERRLLKDDVESASFHFFSKLINQIAVSLTFRFKIQLYHKEENNSNEDNIRQCWPNNKRSIFLVADWLVEKNGRSNFDPQNLPTHFMHHHPKRRVGNVST
jgi:hypothetical protein